MTVQRRAEDAKRGKGTEKDGRKGRVAGQIAWEEKENGQVLLKQSRNKYNAGKLFEFDPMAGFIP